jgi:hypothetical protein
MSTTLDEAVAIFERELPGWWWKVCLCGVSADAWAGPDWSAEIDNDLLTKEALAFARRFDSGFDVELRHTVKRTYTPAEALMAVLQEAKAAREAFKKSHTGPLTRRGLRDLPPDVQDLIDLSARIKRTKRLAKKGDKGAIASLKRLGEESP